MSSAWITYDNNPSEVTCTWSPRGLSSLASFLVSGFCPHLLSFKSQNDPLETSVRTNHAYDQNLLKASHHLNWMKNKILKLTYKALEDLSSPYSTSLLTSIGALAHSLLATLATTVPGVETLHLLVSASQNVHLLVVLSHFFTSFQYFLKFCLIRVAFPGCSINYCNSFEHDFQSHSLLYFPPQYLLPPTVLHIFSC